MGDTPTFHIADDYVALMELKPAERTVYGLLRCNAVFGRNGIANHTVHVTASWFTEMTAHWDSPLPASTARRALNGLVGKGVLLRLNEPQDGGGFVLAFVADPRRQSKDPVNGFEHASRVSKRCGAKVYYVRQDERPGNPSVTGVRHNSRKRPAPQSAPKPPAPPLGDEFRDGLPEMPSPEGSGIPELKPVVDTVVETAAAAETGEPVVEVEELTRLLASKCHGKGLGRRGLLEGEARRVAESCIGSLERGWSPEDIASQLSSLVSDKIHSMEQFLRSRSSDLGDPPQVLPEDGTVLIKGKPVDLGAYAWDEMDTQVDPHKEPALDAAPVPPSRENQEKKERLAKLARQARRHF